MVKFTKCVRLVSFWLSLVSATRSRSLVLATGFMLVGCATGIGGFEKSESSGKAGYQVTAFLLSNGWPADHSKSWAANRFVFSDKRLSDLISSDCAPSGSPAAVAPAVVPLVAALGKLAFDAYMDQQLRAMEELKAAAQVSYSAALTTTRFPSNPRCLLIIRHADAPAERAELGLVALVKLESVKPETHTFFTYPLYLRAMTAAAVTKRAAPNPEMIGVSVAIAANVGVASNPSTGKPAVVSLGSSVFSVPKLPIGSSAAPIVCDQLDEKPLSECPRSGLLALPEQGTAASVTISITETGHGLPVDLRIGELKAVKEALGPAIAESIKALLD